MKVQGHKLEMYKGGNCRFTKPPRLGHNLLHLIQTKKIGNRLLRKGIPLKKKLEKSLDQKMEIMKMTEMRKGRVKRKKKKKEEESEEEDIREQVVKERGPHDKGLSSKAKGFT
ncbi:hypothetical protein Syun_022857 [Stephania yunnanensis]|uniref:Uncharacterized protein n=1 Tax=Stephania yunnanensis TaxID=152371 RepID=A0AAP0I317_9MAGN